MPLHFVRHGQSEANTLRVFSNRGVRHPLTAAGRLQVQELADAFAQTKVDRIWTSPLLRAVESARILSERLGVPYHVSDALREFDVGVLEGTSDEAGWAAYTELRADWARGLKDRRIDGGESLEEIVRRLAPFIESVTSNAELSNEIVVMSHGGLYSVALPYILSNIDAKFANEHGIGHTELIIADRRGPSLVCTRWGSQDLTRVGR